MDSSTFSGSDGGVFGHWIVYWQCWGQGLSRFRVVPMVAIRNLGLLKRKGEKENIKGHYSNFVTIL